MVDWNTLTWRTKDGYNNNIQALCGTNIDLGAKFYEPEKDSDWEILKTNFDSDTGILSLSFRRPIIGNSKDDYTFLLMTEYEFRLVIGNWIS